MQEAPPAARLFAPGSSPGSCSNPLPTLRKNSPCDSATDQTVPSGSTATHAALSPPGRVVLDQAAWSKLIRSPLKPTAQNAPSMPLGNCARAGAFASGYHSHQSVIQLCQPAAAPLL